MSYFRMKHNQVTTLFIIFKCNCIFSSDTLCDFKDKSDSRKMNIDPWTHKNESKCVSCEELTKNKLEPSVVKFHVRILVCK